VKCVFQSQWHSNIQESDVTSLDRTHALTNELIGHEFLYYQETPTTVQFVGPTAVFSLSKLIAHQHYAKSARERAEEDSSESGWSQTDPTAATASNEGPMVQLDSITLDWTVRLNHERTNHDRTR
jgi:hypothetical protein